jgi:hypothetical protein
MRDGGAERFEVWLRPSPSRATERRVVTADGPVAAAVQTFVSILGSEPEVIDVQSIWDAEMSPCSVVTISDRGGRRMLLHVQRLSDAS